MGRVPILTPIERSPKLSLASQDDAVDWVMIAASGTLIASGLLLLSGQRRAGVVAAASGTALALLDQQDVLRQLWKHVPGYIDQVQNMIGKVQGAVEDIAVKGESLRDALAQPGPIAAEPAKQDVKVEKEPAQPAAEDQIPN
jgi:hypothetical protein